MKLLPGAKLGTYEILAAVESTDGGEVYKASDPQSNRDVAIKVLDGAFDERSEQEALAIAALHHPNICALHDIGHEDGLNYLVMECLEGQTLAARLQGGKALPLDKAVATAIEIADALDKGHLAGVTHRNLQPSKIVLTPSGAKVTDFGLAEAKAPGAAAAPASGPTVTTPKGIPMPAASDASLPYTAPECLEGKQGDWRSDIFAFGAILYEMVTGKKAFEGKSKAVLIAAIATTDPDPVANSQPGAPPLLEHVILRCLAKNPEDRWQTVHDLLLQLRWMSEGERLASAAAPALSPLSRALLITAAVLSALLAIPAFLYLRGTGDPAPFQFRVPVRGLSMGDIALSPDGTLIALVARPNTAQPSSLYVRRVGAVSFTRLGGTDDASQPFWSADSRYIAFVSSGRLKQVSAAGGAPKDIAEAQNFSGGSWNREGTILFGSTKGVYRVSAEGGQPAAVTAPDSQETGHFWPSFLPDGQHFLYLAWSAQSRSRAVFVAKLGAKEKTKLMAGESNAQYAAPGYVVFHRESSLFAQPFDAGKLVLRGEPFHIADQVAASTGSGRGNFDVSQDGSVLYFQGASAPAGRGNVLFTNVQWGWLHRTGRPLDYAGEVGPYGDFDLSPDGKLIAVTKQDRGPGADIWVIDWQRAGVTTRLTLDPADDVGPVWSPDGKRIAFTTYRKGNADIYVAEPGSGVGKEIPLLESTADEIVKDWSKDGKYIAYLSGQDSFYDIYALPLKDAKPDPDQKPFPVVQGHFHKSEPQFSYDGKWLAYTSDRTVPGTFQVYVRSFPSGDQEIAVSTAGGGQPRWKGDGKELYYRSPDGYIMAVEIKPGPKLEAGIPHPLFVITVRTPGTDDPSRHLLAVSPDGERFLLRVPPGTAVGNTGVNTAVPEIPRTATTSSTLGSGGRGAAVSTAGANYSGLTVIQHWPSAAKKETK